MTYSPSLCRAALGSVAALCLLGACSTVREYPPQLPSHLGNLPLNGGRTHAITVHPADDDQVIIANQFGGLWKTASGGDRWQHVRGLATVFASDVQYGADGRTVVATLRRDNGVVNGAGIYVSRDGGTTWTRPATGRIPATATSPARGEAWGIALAPDEPGRWYVGTDHGVARSADNGATWEHVAVDATLGLRPDSVQGAANSVLAFPGGTVLALLRTGIYRSDDRGATWRSVRSGNFDFYWGMVNRMDRSPYWRYAFILQDYTTLLLYELDGNRWTALPLPALPSDRISRGPFVRVGKPPFSKSYTTIWIGQGIRALYATRQRISSLRSLDSTDWSVFGRSEGIHDDMGDLGLDATLRPVMLGSDGGVFKPAGSVRTWTSAAPNGSGMNSYQITDLAGNNRTDESGRAVTTLYFSTQDNGLWSSNDGGRTWPNSDCAEGFHIETRPVAAAEPITVAYGKVGCAPSNSMFSDVHMTNQRAVPDLSEGGATLTNMGQAFLLQPGYWMRTRASRGVLPEIFVSTDNGTSWRKRFNVSMNLAGVPQRTKVHAAARYVKAYVPVFTGATLPDGTQQIGLIRLFSPFQEQVNTLGTASILTLPGGGSLGQRATEFDWQAVFGAHPKDWRFVIAPDIAAGDVKMSRDGGRTWATHAGLTAEVTRNGRYRLWDGSPYRMQVTHIAFDPYRDAHIVVGTRDAGVICSKDGGNTWGQIKGTEGMRYVTGFQFQPDGTTLVSTYGRGLWRISRRAFKCEPTRWPLPPLDYPVIDLDRWRRELPRIAEGPDAEELTEPISTDLPGPRLILSSSVDASGQVVVGTGDTLYVYLRGFPPGAPALRVALNEEPQPNLPVQVDGNGEARLEIVLPETLPYGAHLIRVFQPGDPGPQAQAYFVKAHLDRALGEPYQQSVFRPENDRPSDEGPPDKEEQR